MSELAASARFDATTVALALSWVAEVLYALGLLALGLRLRQAEPRRSELLDHLPAGLAVVIHLVSLGLRARALGRFPVASLEESASFLAFLLGCIYVVSALRYRYPAVEAVLLALVVGFQGLAIALPAAGDAPGTDLKSRWFVFHTALSFLGITALFAACSVSLMYLLADWELKTKRPGGVLRFLPSLVTCDETSRRLVILGFPLLTLGILAGWFWSREAGTWRAGPKEMLATVAWLIYAFLLVGRATRGLKGRRAAILSVAAGAVVLGAILGIRR